MLIWTSNPKDSEINKDELTHEFIPRFSKLLIFMLQVTLCLVGLKAAQASAKDYRSQAITEPELGHSQGYLQVYSATTELRDGDAWYFPHTPYIVYTTDGRIWKHVKNQRSAGDEIPEVVALPAGTYILEARSQSHGYLRVRVAIKEGQEAILHLDVWGGTQTRLARS